MHRVTLLSLALTAGCGQVDYMYIDPGDWGATPGGAQDIGAARDVIASGGVPSADAFPVEGLLSEHDLPVAGPPCDDLLCVRPALAVAPWLETGELTTWLQLGMSSGLPAAWERPPLDLVLIIDRSSSMSSDMVETLTGAASAVEQMGPQDRVAVVLFADRPRIAVPLQAVTDVAAIERELFRVDANGGWELMPAMEAGLELLEDAGPDPDRIRRLALFTCSYPGVGPNQDDPFTQLVRRAADERVGTSVYGVILGANPSLSDMLGEVRGGTTSFLESLDKVERVFVDDFDAMVTPLAYDLQVDVQLPAGASIAARYGVPGDGDLAFEATTVFPSRRRGAMLARLDGDVSNGVSASIAYTPEAA
ncbi:MAG TPA: VWA domain-containing protein, partial [Myxococcota bacterium]|nr:VWA domain-containing protein [Myxococcota bacterium]